MGDLTIPLPTGELFTALVTLIVFCYTIYQEVRHRINHKTIKPSKHQDQHDELDKRINVIELKT